MVDKRIGNQFWKARSKHGRKKIFATPKDLWQACQEYFQWCDDNPLYETKLVSYQGFSTLEDVPKRRVKTVMALQLFLRINAETWSRYRKKKDFYDVIVAAEKEIYTDKFEGATTGFYNAKFIARDLGLADRQYTVTEDVTEYRNPMEELKKRGIPMPEIDIDDFEDFEEDE